MKTLFVLLIAFGVALLLQKLTKKSFNIEQAGRIAMAAMLVFASIGHFAFVKGMAAMIPDFIPMKTFLVYATGVLEIFFAIGLLLPKYQKITAWMLIIFLILILPANIKAAIEHINYQTGALDGKELNYLWFRVPLQLLFIGWTYFFGIKKNS